MITKILNSQGEFTGVTAKVTNIRDCLVVLKQAELTDENLVVSKVGRDGSIQLYNGFGRVAFTFKKVG